MKTVRICYFGIYHPAHPRNAIVLSALKDAGFEVVEIVNRTPGLGKYVDLARRLLRVRNNIDCVMVGFPGQQAAMLARLVYRGPVIFNALLSLYDAVIADRKRYRRFGPRALYFWCLDFFSAHLSTVILLDCNAYIDFFARRFFVPRKKFVRVFLGAQEGIIAPLDVPEIPYEIHYYSSFIPTHGTDTIIRAAKLLEKSGITFILSGAGQCLDRDTKFAEDLHVANVQFIPRLKDLEELNRFINSSWVCLGVFGSNPRVERSIGSKVFEQLYCGRPVITGNTAATRELLTDGVSALLVALNDPEDLAKKIALLRHDNALRLSIARAGAQAYADNASQKIISRQLSDIISNI